MGRLFQQGWLMANLAQCLNRLVRNFSPNSRDVSLLRAGEQTRVFDAFNGALTRFYEFAPNHIRTEELSQIVRAPATITCTTTAGSKTFAISTSFPTGSYTSSDDIIGQSIIFAGDPNLNHIESATTLWRAATSTGTVTATVYNDALQFSTTDYRIVGPVKWTGGGYNYAAELYQWQAFNPWMTYSMPENPFVRIGRPTHYMQGYHQPLTIGTTAQYWFLRLWPLPSYAGNVSYNLQGQPTFYKLSDLSTARTVPVPDQYIPLVIKLAQPDLMGSDLWNPAVDKKAEASNAEVAWNDLQRLSAHSNDTTPRPCGTPRGF